MRGNLLTLSYQKDENYRFLKKNTAFPNKALTQGKYWVNTIFDYGKY